MKVRDAIDGVLTDTGADLWAELGTDAFHIDDACQPAIDAGRDLDWSGAIGPRILRRRDADAVADVLARHL